MSNRSWLIQGPTVLTMLSHAPTQADILIIEGRIQEIGAGLQVPAGVTVIDATGQIAMPGMINSHIHLWQAGLRGIAGDWSFAQYFERVIAGIASRMTPDDLR